MANRIAWFLKVFGLRRELDELREQVGKAVAAGNNGDAILTFAEYLRESGLGEDELQSGNLNAAYTRFMKLLERIEALPEDTSLDIGSYQRCTTLGRLARCLEAGKEFVDAEKRLREALAVNSDLVKRQPDNQNFIQQRSAILTDLGDVLREQGRYLQAKSSYEEALEID